MNCFSTLYIKTALSIIGCCIVSFANSQTCTYSNQTIAAANTILNTNYPATANAASGSTSITLGASTGASTAIAAGDLLLIIQMQNATQNSSNTDAYGDGVSGSPASGFLSSTAGTYEFAYAANAVPLAGGTLNLVTAITNSYVTASATVTQGQQRFQVVRVPQFNNLTINAAQSITCSQWDGSSGGIVALNVTGTLNMNTTGTIHANSKGFRGGGGRQLGGGAGASTDFRTNATVNTNGAKGEGICGTPRYVYNGTALVNTGVEGYPNGSNGKGAPGNAGGGATNGNPAGNNEHSGGGGGGNGGAGGLGGRTWNSNLNVGGTGGVAPGFLATTRLLMGGGGGAGTNSNGTGTLGSGLSSSGSIGGGIILLKVNTISNAGTVSANGANALSVDNDGGGGGGAGGSIYISATVTASLATLTVNARGGQGGSAWSTISDAGAPNDGNPEHGPGGGGGGGVIYSNASLVAGSSVAGGTNGVTTTSNLAFSATAGSTGVKNQAAPAISLPAFPTATASNNGPICDVSDVTVSATPTISNASYAWTGPNSFSSTSQNFTLIAATVANAGTYSVSYTLGSCVVGPASTVVSTNPSTSLTATVDMVSMTQGGTTTYASCFSLIAQVTSNGASPISGSTTARAWVETSQSTEFVKRHYQITPASNAATATGTVTLYFTQGEFDAFNAVNLVKLPTGPSDAIGKANLLIEKRGGNTNDGSGLPGSYTGSITTIDPVDANIVWNSSASRWEVTFAVTGFSGFFVKTNSFILPVKWINATVNKNNNQEAEIKWTVDEYDVESYYIEKSSDGIHYQVIGTVNSIGNGENSYRFRDISTLQKRACYRIRQLGKNGKNIFSPVLFLHASGDPSIIVLPNPASDEISIISKNLLNTRASIFNIDGKLVKEFLISQNNTSIGIRTFPSGLYLLRFDNGEVFRIVKK